MSVIKQLLAAASLLSLTACTTATGTNMPIKAEPLHSVAINAGELIIEVTSNGCTQATDFKLHVSESADSHSDAVLLTIERIKPDLCRRRAMAQRFSFKLANHSLQGRTVIINNNLVAGPGPIKRN